MKMNRWAAPALAMLAIAAMPATALAQQKCMSRAESRAVVAHLMPDLVASAATRCGRSGSAPYLAANGTRLAERMTPLSRRNAPAAIRALEKQSGTKLPDNELILRLGRAAIADGVTREMDADACTMVDRLLEQLAPLPPENLANVFALFLEAGATNAKKSPITICEAKRL